MPIKIYNSLTRSKDIFTPIDNPNIKMYVCGPTVYDEPHIGHARSAYIFDVIRRYLSYKGYNVKFVRNVTDVDDKIIDKAKKEFPGEDLNSSFKKVAEKYLDSYHKDMDSLGIQRPTDEPKATEYILRMIKFIENLIERGAAYESKGDVYFDIKKAKNYGKLSNQSLDAMESGARVHPGENKLEPMDFALWKSAKENEPSWDSPWGKGRPGWHIECSCMSSDLLGDEFDIHGGGIDLIFPHHENEVAQSEGAGKKFARYWIHNGLLTINKEKMAKSLGNFITIKKILEKFHPDVLKIFFLQTHYSNPIDYSIQIMEEEKKRYKSFIYLFSYKSLWENKPMDLESEIKKEIDNYKLDFEEAMDDNFNTPKALGVLEKMKSYCYSLLVNDTKNINASKLNYAANLFLKMTNVFGLAPDSISPDKDFSRWDTDSGYKEVIVDYEKLQKWAEEKKVEREALKKEKRYQEADIIRKELDNKGYIVLDKKDGTSELRRK